MVPKFLIDECLSPTLALLARTRGYLESSHVTWIGKGGWKDWELKTFILENDWSFVTRNSYDFRGSKDTPGVGGQYSDVHLHAGLVCINGPDLVNASTEAALFGEVLALLDGTQFPNEVIEATLSDDGSDFEIARYSLPAQA